MFKKTLLATALVACGAAQAFMPQNGLWAVPSEIDGSNPGRGVVVDAQGGTLFLTVYTYEADGRPVYYTASGDLGTNEAGQRTFSAQLKYSQGGPGLAATGNVTNGSFDDAKSPGTVTLTFTGTGSGVLRLPGAGADVQIARYNFKYAPTADSLLGSWTWGHPHGNHSHFFSADLVQKAPATATGNGVVQRSNGLHGCEFQVSGAFAGRLLCVSIGAANDQGLRNVDVGNFAFGPNESDGLHRRIRGWQTDSAAAGANATLTNEVLPAFARRLQGLDALPTLFEGENPIAPTTDAPSEIHQVINWVVTQPDFFVQP